MNGQMEVKKWKNYSLSRKRQNISKSRPGPLNGWYDLANLGLCALDGKGESGNPISSDI
jgi:hypothetical protein